jgi:hypothetical protein
MIRNVSRTKTLQLCLEFLEDRRLLSGMTFLPEVHSSHYADGRPDFIGPVQHTVSDEHIYSSVYSTSEGQARTFVHPANDQAAGVSDMGRGARAEHFAQEDQADGTKALFSQAHDEQRGATAADATDQNDGKGAWDLTKSGDDNPPPAPHHPSAAPAGDTNSDEPHHHHHQWARDDQDAGGASAVSAPRDRSHADRATDPSDQATPTDRATDEATDARAPAEQQADSAEDGRTAADEAMAALTPAVYTVAATGAAQTRLPAAKHYADTEGPVPHPAASAFAKAPADSPQGSPAHDQHAAQGDRTESPLAAPAHEEAPALAANAAVVQVKTASLVRPEAGADRPAGILNALFLAVNEGHGDFGSWDSSLAVWDLAAAQEAESQGATIRVAAGAPTVRQAVSVSEVAFLPQASALAAGFLAADADALEEAVREFLNGLDTAGRELTRVLADNGWARWAVVATLTALAAEAGRRRLRERARRGGAAAEEEAVTLSWLSGSYPFRTEDL